MRLFSAVFLLGLLLGVLALACGSEGDSSKLLVRARRGFGCPWSARACHAHCQSIGRRGGYCRNRRLTCTCYQN
ncbi:defensin-1-like [Haemaphysalis longicornis]